MPKAEAPGVTGTPSSGSRLSLRNWKLRSKLALVLTIPTLTALGLAAVRAHDQLSDARAFEQTTAQVDLANRVVHVVHLLQGERSLAVAKIINSSDPQTQTAFNTQTEAVDEAVVALRTEASRLEVDDPSSRERYERGLDRLDALGPLRGAVNTPPYSELAAFDTYTSVLDSLVQLGREVTSSVNDQQLLRRGSTLQAVSEIKEYTSREDTALAIVAMRGEFSVILLDQIRAAQFSAQAAYNLFKANATPEQLQEYTDTVSGPDVDARARLAATALAHASNNSAPGISPAELSTTSSETLNKIHTFEHNLLSALRAQSEQLADSATIAAWRDIAIVLGAIVLSLVLTFLVTRTMLGPLRALRKSALDIAYTRLPEAVNKILEAPDPVAASKTAAEPVPVTTREEIGEVARSFDAVQEQAIKMAAEQALLRENVNGIFVNLSRRSQRLVERQLSVIDRLEADEQDPDHLASLFELDHLATRLRRNGESLLVLSGAGLAKSVPKPVSAADVIGAAVSEIEQYARVDVGTIPDVAVRGLTVHDLVHLLAELLDNATYFSEPETKVNVRAVVTRRRALAIQITDRGVGMSEEQIAEANKRLADPPDLDVSVTRRMGLYVVARLAQRHGIEVRLRENEDIEGGVIARVVVPAELLGPVPSEAPPPPPQSATEISWPSTEPSDQPAAEVPSPRPRPAAQPEQPATGGLRPLDQPISLDDLVAGSSNAAFLSKGTGTKSSSPRPSAPATGTTPAQPSWPGSTQLPKRQPGGSAQPVAEPAPEPAQQQETPAPTPEPAQQWETPAPEPAPTLDPVHLDEDDLPTKRLPIYQSVVSRWFSPEEDFEPTENSTSDGESGEGEASSAEPAVDPWRSAADEGWQAAQALLEPKNEEITPAGLPKRVPNAYLVPGSVSAPQQDSFRDMTSASPGQSAIVRSATAARERMVSFQRGYTSGRHALREGTGQNSTSVNGREFPPAETEVRSDE